MIEEKRKSRFNQDVAWKPKGKKKTAKLERAVQQYGSS